VDDATAQVYRAFARHQATGSSPILESWALGVAGDPDTLALIDRLPTGKRQPNLVFAAARWLGCPDTPSYPDFRRWLLEHWDRVADVVRARLTQTNEAGRCAVLLPALAALPGPLALLEVGASAGLCLYPDRYSYAYRSTGATRRVDPPAGPSAVSLPCAVDDIAVAPARVPTVVWRAGIDVRPLDVADAGDLAWLTALIWPEHELRRTRLRQAAAIARREPPRIVGGDLNEQLAAVAATAPADATLVVFHSAVLVYLPLPERLRLAEQVRDLGATWVSNEGAAVLPEVSDRLPRGLDAGDRFVLSVDGWPVALTGPHGQSYRSLR